MGAGGEKDQINFFRGLDRNQRRLIRQRQSYWMSRPGQVIIRQNDTARSLFIVLSGRIEVYRGTRTGRAALIEMGPGSVIGEIGILIESSRRTASVRAVEPTLLLEIPDPIELSNRLGDPCAVIQLLKNLIALLGKRLRHRDSLGSDSMFLEAAPIKGFGQRPEVALETIARGLPRGLWGVFKRNQHLAVDEYLCRQGEPSADFYFIHGGRLVVIKELEGAKERKLRTLAAPALVGEVGFFSGEPRSASLRAAEAVEFTLFSGEAFRRLEEQQPEETINILFAAVRLTIYLVLKR